MITQTNHDVHKTHGTHGTRKEHACDNCEREYLIRKFYKLNARTHANNNQDHPSSLIHHSLLSPTTFAQHLTMSSAVTEYLEAQKNVHPDLQDKYAQLADLHKKK